MADDTNDLFIFGDDFEVILEILESYGGLGEQFMSAVSELSVKCFIFYFGQLISSPETCI